MHSGDIAIDIRDSTRPTAPPPSSAIPMTITHTGSSSASSAISRLAAVDRPVLAHLLSFLDARSLAALCEATQIAKNGSQPPKSSLQHTPTTTKSSSAVIAAAANADELWNAAFDRDFASYLRQNWLREKRSAKRHYLEQVAIAHRRCAFEFALELLLIVVPFL
jgi:hypothetical protein